MILCTSKGKTVYQKDGLIVAKRIRTAYWGSFFEKLFFLALNLIRLWACVNKTHPIF